MVAGVYWALPYSALLLLEGASAIESKTHGRPWPCEREGPSEAGRDGAKRKVFDRELQAWRQKPKLKEQMLDEDLEADGDQDEATEDFGAFVEAVADFFADQQAECREQEGRDSDDQDG